MSNTPRPPTWLRTAVVLIGIVSLCSFKAIDAHSHGDGTRATLYAGGMFLSIVFVIGIVLSRQRQ